MARARILLAWLLLGLAGCSSTVFESAPAGIATDCDPAWPGRWQALPTGDEASSPNGTLEISADCRTATTSERDPATGGKRDKTEPLDVSLVDTDHGQYLQLRDDDGKPDCLGKSETHCGHMLLRYEREGDIIRLYDADHARVAAAIRKGSIRGYSQHHASAQPGAAGTDDNFVAGDPVHIARVLRRHPELFESTPFGVLQRAADQTVATEPDIPATEPPAQDRKH